MRKRAIIAAVSLLMGALLQAGCDETDELDAADMLLMSELANSKYYLRFDVDYDNDSVVDEHVEIRVTRHFNNLPGYRYQAEFMYRLHNAWIDLPNETTELSIYSEDSSCFEFQYESDIDDRDYSIAHGHDFEFIITEWNKSNRTIRAIFSGILVYHHEIGDEKSITISNGELYARVIKYYGE